MVLQTVFLNRKRIAHFDSLLYTLCYSKIHRLASLAGDHTDHTCAQHIFFYHVEGLQTTADRRLYHGCVHLCIISQLQALDLKFRSFYAAFHLFISLGRNIAAFIEHLHAVQIGLRILKLDLRSIQLNFRRIQLKIINFK